jgi:serine protease
MSPQTVPSHGYRRRLVVKLRRDEVTPPMAGAALGWVPQLDALRNSTTLARTGRLWSELTDEFPALEVKKLFSALGSQHLLSLSGLSAAAAETAAPRVGGMLGYFALDVPPAQSSRLLSRVQARPEVELAYLEGGPCRPPEVQATVLFPARVQHYLDPAPVGIDAAYAARFPGGQGQNVQLIDLERGWLFSHDELAGLGIAQPISGLNRDFFGHGTSVLGMIAAPGTHPNGVTGIAPRLGSVEVVSQWREGDYFSTAEALHSAITALNEGDVLLLEAQTNLKGAGLDLHPQDGFLPVEVEPAIFEAIQHANDLGITVVEAAGNGNVLLDDVTVRGQAVFDRGVRDSGAILVGAAGIPGDLSVSRSRLLNASNYGGRIDCHGWGNSVVTAGDTDDELLPHKYTNHFSGTSAASAMVAGAALLVQSLAKASGRSPFSPAELRRILSDPGNGTATSQPAADRIGVMPDLKKIIQNELHLPPLGPVPVN